MMSRLPKIANPHRKAYPSDLSDAEWELIKPLLPAAKGFGHPRTVDLREVLNSIFYVHRLNLAPKKLVPRKLPRKNGAGAF